MMEKRFKRRYAPFQIEISKQIVKNYLKGDGEDIYIEVARQAGKTTAVVETVSVLSTIANTNWGLKPTIGVFAPQKEQSKTDFDKMKVGLTDLQKAGHKNAGFSESNANTIVLRNENAVFYSFSLEGGNIESKSNNLQIYEESQKIFGKREKKMKVEAFPMAAAYNAPRIFIGSGGYNLCYYYNGIQENKDKPGRVFRFPYQEIIKQKRKLYEETGDPFHLKYEQFIAKEKDNLGEYSDEFKSQYELVWNLSRGMYVTKEKFEKMALPHPSLDKEPNYPCFVGIDVGKKHDSSVVSVVRFKNGYWVRIAFKMWIGDNYSHQFKEMVEFLSNYNVAAMAIDSTGQGDWLPDRFDDETSYSPYHFVFSRQAKDKLYRHGMQIFQSDKFRYLQPPNQYYADQNIRQYVNLVKEYKGEYLAVYASEDNDDNHDDIPDADHLALWAGKQYMDGGMTGEVIIERKNTANWGGGGWKKGKFITYDK